MVRQHREEVELNRHNNDFNAKMEEERLRRKVKSVLDNIDSMVLRDYRMRERRRREQLEQNGNFSIPVMAEEKELDSLLQLI